VLSQKGLPSKSDGKGGVFNVAIPGKFWYEAHPANKDAGQVYDSAWISRDFVTSHRWRCHEMMKCV
jgi:hypothetical protein